MVAKNVTPQFRKNLGNTSFTSVLFAMLASTQDNETFSLLLCSLTFQY